MPGRRFRRIGIGTACMIAASLHAPPAFAVDEGVGSTIQTFYTSGGSTVILQSYFNLDRVNHRIRPYGTAKGTGDVASFDGHLSGYTRLNRNGTAVLYGPIVDATANGDGSVGFTASSDLYTCASGTYTYYARTDADVSEYSGITQTHPCTQQRPICNELLLARDPP